MRIAQIAPPWFPVPPVGYGGIELIVGLLVDGLVDRGHDVTLFGAHGSGTRGRLVVPLEETPDPALLGNVWYDAQHALMSYLHADEFDVIHDHSGIVGPALGALVSGSVPVVHTLHGPWTEQSYRYHRTLQDRVHLVAISESQRGMHPDLRVAATVHNGIALDDYPLCTEKDDFLVFIGRANPDKGLIQAIEVARRTGRHLVMVVKRNEPFEVSFWHEVVMPHLHEGVEVLENVSHEVKVDLLGRAQAMIFPIQWPEPFGLVMIEAMACGTPVIACPAGAAVELVEDGVTGFLRGSIEDLTAVVERASECSPAVCRARVAELYSASAMVQGYERVFVDVIDQLAATKPR